MIKVHTYITELGNRVFYICDFCGAGISEESGQEDIDNFVQEHGTCTHEENTNLAFLDTDPELVP